MSAQAQPFRRFLIIRNPVSTNAAIAARRISELQRAFPAVEAIVVETLPGGREANARLLRPYGPKLGRQTLLCIAGGDGTINTILEELLHDPKLPAAARHTPIFPLWGGNANDLAHMLNGRGWRTNLPALIRAGQVIKVFPLSCSLTDAHGKVTTHVAAAYASFGASAITTQVLSKQTVRLQATLSRIPLLRSINEVFIAVPAMTQAPKFLALEQERHKTVYEYAFFNGSRFAKINGVKRKLNDQTFHKAIIERKRLSDLVISAVALSRKGQANKFETTHADFTILEATWVQFDGEPMHVYAGTQVAIDIDRQPFYALSNRLTP